MTLAQIKLEYDDPTVFAKCSGDCSRHYPGKNVDDYFAKAYTDRKWKRGPVCDNCNAPMKFLYEVARE
jgi:hypothetical protein